MTKKKKEDSLLEKLSKAWTPTDEQKDFIIDQILEGKSVIKILKESGDDLNCSRSSFEKYLDRDPEFADRVQWARDRFSGFVIDQVVDDLEDATLANYVLNIARAQTRMKLASVLNPSRWHPNRNLAPAAPPSFRTDAEAQARMVAQAKAALERAKERDAS